MEKRTKLGVAAMSLAAAATMIAPAQASADEVCIDCPPGPAGGAEAFEKISFAFDRLFLKVEFLPEQVFEKLDPVFEKLGVVFDKTQDG